MENNISCSAVIVAGGCYFLGGFARLLPQDVVSSITVNGKAIEGNILPLVAGDAEVVVVTE